MGAYFARHDFLVPNNGNPETDSRQHASTIFVASGTTPDTVVTACLGWVKRYWAQSGPFSIDWFTPGTLVASTLRDFRTANQERRSAASMFLFGGTVDPDVESVTGPFTVDFAETQLRHTVRFTSCLHSAYRFDIESGYTYFFFSSEVSLQRACAQFNASRKFLFFDPSKLNGVEGHRGYNITELLLTSDSVTIYTVQTEDDDDIKARFDSLCRTILLEHPQGAETKKSLQLLFVSRDGASAKSYCVSGYLNPTKILPTSQER